MNTEGVWAALPVKDIEDAKQRLSPVLSPDERRGLFRCMLEDVLASLADAKTLTGIAVITRHPHAMALARDYGARVETEADNLGQTAAVTLAAERLEALGARAMLAVPADIPLATGPDFDAVVRAHRPGTAVTIAPAHDDLGSNAVLCSPPGILPLRFGDNSFWPHLERARSLGVEPTVVRRPRIALDIDGPDDLRAFLATPSTTRAYRYLESAGIVARLGSAA